MTDETQSNDQAAAESKAPAAKKPSAKEQAEAAKKAAESKAPKIPMSAPEGATEASVAGTTYKVKSGRIMALVDHVEQLIAHGFEVVVKDLEKL